MSTTAQPSVKSAIAWFEIGVADLARAQGFYEAALA
jgi:predicted enzyme related to lactoylglutathione lyase